MKALLRRALVLSLSCSALSTRNALAGDPCDFASSDAPAFSYEQVKACYEAVPFRSADLANIVAVVAQHRSFSDLAEIYEQRVHWKSALTALSDRDYPNDFAMHEAIKAEHRNLRNVHVAYVPPTCYWQMLTALGPFDFGSTTRFAGPHAKQIVFVENALLPDVYRSATGIDLASFVGMKVVSINGTPTLDYFRKYGRERLKTHEDDGGHLNGVLTRLAYSVRFGGPYDFIPERPADDYILESRDGHRVQVTLPWIFLRASLFFGDGAVPLTSSTAEFAAACTAPPPPVTPGASAASVPGDGLRGPEIDRDRRRLVKILKRKPSPHSSGFFEVPPQEIDQDVETVIPPTGTAEVLQYKGHVTVLRLANTVGWIDVARQGIAHACEHSDRLIVDLRANGGGNDTTILWLYRHLFPQENDLVAAGKLPLRVRNDNPTFNEIMSNSALFDVLAASVGEAPCQLTGFGPGCLTDLATGGTLGLDDLTWFQSPSFVERRAHAPVSLSRQFGLPLLEDNPVFDGAACAGRFAGDDLVLLTDGSNASGGYFLPAAFKGKGIIVTMGGYVDEPLAMGRARGGATWPGSIWALAAQLEEQLTGGLIHYEHSIAGFQRQVETRMEMFGAYRKDLTRLHTEDPVEEDLRIDVWSDSPGTDGYVYRHVLEAVDDRRHGRR